MFKKQNKKILNTSYLIPRTNAGFSMVELLVAVSIFMVVTSVLLVNYPKFSSKILLENVAYEVALSARQAQSYGLNVRVASLGGGNTSFPTYGVHFSLNGINSNDPSDSKTFVLFADLLPDTLTPTANNKKYDAVSGCDVIGGECVEKFSIQNTNQIYMLCGNLKSTGANIDNWGSISGADCSLTSLDISFTRPDPDAYIIGYSTLTGNDVVFSDAEIVLRSPRGSTKNVVVWQTGQISVE